MSKHLFIFVLFVVAASGQVNPELIPSAKPSLPKIVENACPFEGCTFGKWRAQSAVTIYSSWKEDRKVQRKLRQGESVTAITGIHIAFEPAEIEITSPLPKYGLKPGDIVLNYMNQGEGFFSAWFKGYWVENFDGSGVQYPDGSGCTRNCASAVSHEIFV